ncbi:hypothetical protein Glove_364g72 [Diversispora epigaea]|uniref:F-box domain-containing protein n=1 Tax=Diversispora epigaea TaxID=1348612 RepID=A0A397HCN6_9GLOM|nr:hypothetical protein Glove_364g72 [Diversispora epigaea]
MNIYANPPATHALLIPEILENILFHFSNDDDLFKILAVNHIWRSEGFRALIKLYKFCFNVWVERFNIVSPYSGTEVKNYLRSFYSHISDIFYSIGSLRMYKLPIHYINFSKNLSDLIDDYIHFLRDIDDKINTTSDFICWKIDFYDSEDEEGEPIESN